MAVKYTNKGLVEHAKTALGLKTKYMWGGLLRSITEGYIKTLRGIYGVNPSTGYTETRYKELATYCGKGYYGCDCVGLIKSYYWSGRENGGTGSPNYAAPGYPDVNAGTMYNRATVKGDIKTLPEKPGVIVYCKTHPHVGVYIGNGEIIESTLSKRGDGVCKTKLKDFTWEYWFECPYIEYVKEPVLDTEDVILAFAAVVRLQPSSKAKKLARLGAGTKTSIIKGTETIDKKSGYEYEYIELKAGGWIVKSAIKK